MKTILTLLKNRLLLAVSLGSFFLTMCTASIAQNKDKDQVKVKIVKIVDGDTSTIEKTMDEANVQDFTKQFQNIKGKNVQVMVTVEDVNKKNKKGKGDKSKSASSMNFNFDMDSSSANSFAKAFVFSDNGMLKSMELNDSMFKNLPKNFNFNFDFNDEGAMNDFNFDINTDKDGKVIIKNGKGKTIVINGDEDHTSGQESEEDNGKTRTKTKSLVMDDDKGNKKKKVIVTTSVTVIDESGNSNKRSKSEKEENNFSFYPNPSDGNFVLDLNLDEKENTQVKITDMNGKEVYNEIIAIAIGTGNGKVSKTIDLNGKKGTFIVTIKQGNKTTSKKIIIE